MAQGLTKKFLQEQLGKLSTKIDLESMEARITGSIRDLNTNFIKSQGLQNERMDQEFGKVSEQLKVMDVKLSALMEESVVRKELRNLVGELHDKGVAVENDKIFLSKSL